MKFLSIDGKFYKALNTIWSMVKLNFLWIIFSLPIFTIGAATIAAFSITNKMIEEKEGYIVKDFYNSFKSNFKQGVILGIITIFLSYSIYLNIELFNKIENNPIVFLILAILVGFVGVIHLIYAFPLLARYENTIKETLFNSREISFKYIFSTIIMILLIALLVIVFSFNYVLIFLGILFGPSSIFLLISSFSIRNFKKIEENNKE